MANKKEIRSYASKQPTLSLRAGSDGGRTVKGTAVVYNQLSEDFGGWREKISPGAFTKSLRSNPDLMILANHDTGKILGRVSSGTATVTDGPDALRFTCTLGKSSYAVDIADSLTRGDIRSCSFGFTCTKDDWTQEGNQIIRTVQEAVIFELSLVPDPAYTQTSAGLRSALATLPTELRSRIATQPDDDQDDCDPDQDDDCEEDRDQEQDDCPGEDDDDYDESDRCHDEQDDEERSDQLRIRQLFHNRLTANSLN